MNITRSKDNTPQLSLLIQASHDSVWSALRDKEKLLQWHGWETPTLEDEIEDIYFTNVKEEINDGERTLVVNGGDAFVLKPREGATELTLVRAGLSGDSEWDAYYDNITEGWVSFMEQLRFLLEYAPESLRRTTFTRLTLKKDDILTGLNLGEEKEGLKFAGSFQEEAISGTIWFSTPSQLGLVIDTWGPGLLIFQFSENGCIATHQE